MGYVLIFNNETFDIPNISSRENSKKDILSLKNVFYKFDFRIKIVRNPTLEDIRNNMRLIAEEDLNSALCLIVVIMTHGLEYNHAYAKDQIYNIEEEIFNSTAFQKFQSLPKILITQACKVREEDFKPVESLVDVHNTLRFDSCFEGSKAVRGQKGAIFIQSLCEHLDKDGLYLDFERIASNVRQQFENQFKLTGVKQVPTLFKYVNGFEKLCLGQKVRKDYNIETMKEMNFIAG